MVGGIPASTRPVLIELSSVSLDNAMSAERFIRYFGSPYTVIAETGSHFSFYFILPTIGLTSCRSTELTIKLNNN